MTTKIGTSWRRLGALSVALWTACTAPPGGALQARLEAAPDQEPTAARATELPPQAQPAVPSPLLEPAIAVAPAPRVLPPVVCAIETDAPARTFAVEVGQEVAFVNRDAICHGLFSSSEPNAFDLGILRPGATSVVRFQHPGTVRVYCSMHEHQHLTIQVSPGVRQR